MGKKTNIYCDKCKKYMEVGQNGTITPEKEKMKDGVLIEYIRCNHCDFRYVIMVHTSDLNKMIAQTKKARCEYKAALICNARPVVIRKKLMKWEGRKARMMKKSKELRDRYNEMLNKGE